MMEPNINRIKKNAFVCLLVYVICFILTLHKFQCEGQLIRMDGQHISTDYILYVLKGLYAYGENDEPFVLVGKKKDLNMKVPHIVFENVGISTTDDRNTKYFSFQNGEKEKGKEKEKEKETEKETEKEKEETETETETKTETKTERAEENEEEAKEEEKSKGDGGEKEEQNGDGKEGNESEEKKKKQTNGKSKKKQDEDQTDKQNKTSNSESDDDSSKGSNSNNSISNDKNKDESDKSESYNGKYVEQKGNADKDKKKKFPLNLYKNNPYMRRKEETEYMPAEEDSELPYLFLELVITKEKDFNETYLPQNNKICCSKEEANGRDGELEYTCPGEGYIKRYKNVENFFALKLPVYFINDRVQYDDEPFEYEVTKKDFLKKIEKSISHKITETSIYALFLSNCVESKTHELNLHGNIHILNNYGYLPGDKIAKLNLYFFCMIIFLTYFLIWLSLLILNRKYVIKIQMWILACLSFYVMEHCFLFFYFLEYNLNAKVNNKLLIISVCFSILKNVCSYLLILLGSLGWGITVPTLDKQTSLKIKFLFFFFILFDFIKQFLDLYLHDSVINSIFVFLYICPITLIYTIIYLWIFSSSSKIIIQLNEDKQYEKLNMFKRFFNVLVFTVIFALISFLIDVIVILDIGNISWNLKCYLSNGVSSFLFILILTAMMFLFKPSERLKRISHFTEIGDMDELEDFSNFKMATEDIP